MDSPAHNKKHPGWIHGKPTPRDWPEDWTHENGGYLNVCYLCRSEFIGHKRRNVCRVCASSAAEKGV